jgi:RNA polymerase sigma factor (sigma-70 family)
MNHTEITHLTRRAQAGDARAAGELLLVADGAMVRYAARIVGNRWDAEEVVQNARLQALKALPHFRCEKAWLPWFRVIVQREAYDFLRAASAEKRGGGRDTRRSVPAPLEAALGIPDPAPGPEERLEQAVFAQEVWDTLGRLLPLYTVTLALLAYGYGEEECAARLGCARGTIRSRIYRGKRRFQAEWRGTEE